MARHSVQHILAMARAADPAAGLPRPRRAEDPATRPLSTGNLLADCERWCRDHLPARPRAQVPGGSPGSVNSGAQAASGPIGNSVRGASPWLAQRAS